MSVYSLLVRAMDILQAADVDSPRLDAEALMAHVLGTDRAGVYARLRDEPAGRQRGAFLALVEKRAGRYPLQYILGETEFCGRAFFVSPDVLIPRPETELLVEEGAALLKDGEAPLVADLGTGSGCIAVSLATLLSSAVVYAVDSSPAALAVARRNAEAHGVEGRVRLLSGDLFGPLRAEGLAGRLDLVVSNPPYVPSGDIAGLQPEVLYEPVSALDGGPDGLDAIRRIIHEAPEYLKSGGTLLVEIGFGQGEAVRRLVAEQPGLEREKLIEDFAGIERVLVARRSP